MPITVSLIIVALNLIVFVADWILDFGNSPLILWGAKYGPAIWSGETYRLLTAIFLHAGFLHLLTNSWALYVTGPVVEGLIGPWRFLGVYLISGLMGGVASLLFRPFALSVGASGAIFGLFGYLLFLRWRRPGLLPPVVNQWLTSILGVNLVISFIPGTRIDLFAHVGGLFGGLASGFVVGVPNFGTWQGTLSNRILRWVEAVTALVVLVALYWLSVTPPGSR